MAQIFDTKTRNWVDLDIEAEDALANLGASVADGLITAEEAVSLVIAEQQRQRAEGR